MHNYSSGKESRDMERTSAIMDLDPPSIHDCSQRSAQQRMPSHPGDYVVNEPYTHALNKLHRPDEDPGSLRPPQFLRAQAPLHLDDRQAALEHVLEAEKGVVVIDSNFEYAPLTTLTLDRLLSPVGCWPVNTPQTNIPDTVIDTLIVAVEIHEGEDRESSERLIYAIEYDPNSKPSRYQLQRLHFYALAVLSIVVAVVIAVSVSAHVTKSRIDPTMTPTSSPSSAQQHMFKEAFAKLVGDIVFDETTPYYRAALWIFESDPLHLDLSDSNLIQRFTAVLFYMLTVGNAGIWKTCNPSNENETNSCTYLPIADYSSDMAFGDPVSATRWLSGTHECEWLGVTCDEFNSIRELKLSALGIGGTIPTEISSLLDLKVLQLSYNDLTGTLPSDLVQNKNLLRLEVHYNSLSGSLPFAIFGMGNLQVFNFENNAFTGSIPSAIGGMKNLKGLFLAGNMFSGHIPSEIGRCNELIFAHIERNQFTGQIPTEMGLLKHMREFWAGENFLSGTLPSEIGTMLELESLVLMGGTTAGTIPEEFYNASRLRDVDLLDMNLIGTISSRVMGLQGLHRFRVRGNNFTGEIPVEFASIAVLELAWFHLNDFSGSMPAEICRMRNDQFLTQLDTDCSPDDGIPAFGCDCCTVCCVRKTAVCTKTYD